ncbi:MAG: BamA/TamA family outer membrane protein, partial [bacterium]|nr:BamA/TamA family outer membrane protein [bacterium]
MNYRLFSGAAALTLCMLVGCVQLNPKPVGHNLAPNGMPIRERTAASKPPIEQGAAALANEQTLGYRQPNGDPEQQPVLVRGQAPAETNSNPPQANYDPQVRQAQYADQSNVIPGARPGIVPNPQVNPYANAGPPVNGQYPPPPGGVQPVDPLGMPENFADINAFVQEARTGRFMFGVGFNSEAGVTGQIVIDERNFDITKPPLSYNDFIYGNPFRGGGQGFRLEAVPGTQVQRYLMSFSEPHLRGSQVSLNTSAFFFDRNYFDWDEQRYGGRIATGYRLSHDLSLSLAGRIESINIHDPRVAGVAELDEVLGKNDLYSGQVSL